MPISAVRFATAAYMVLSAPNVAPVPMMTGEGEHQDVERARGLRLLGVVGGLGLGLEGEASVGFDAPHQSARVAPGATVSRMPE